MERRIPPRAAGGVGAIDLGVLRNPDFSDTKFDTK
jgi:hypothetical protein